MTTAKELAPNLDVDEWVQGNPSNIDLERGRVVLIGTFQLNCPGCFLFSIPELITLYEEFKARDLVVWGLATAFKDFHLNNLENLKILIEKGETVGESHRLLKIENRLSGNKLEYKIPFPIAFDKLIPNDKVITETIVRDYIERNYSQFELLREVQKKLIRQQVEEYLKNKTYKALTFEKYNLRGTPSVILIDKKGVLRKKWFGSGHSIKTEVAKLLTE